MKGFSPRNLKYMRAFAEAWPDEELCNSLLHKSPGTQRQDLDHVKDPAERQWYIGAAIQHGWSRMS